MTSITAIFGQSREDARDSEKLLELYWNRAELKKDFADLRNETFRLKDQIRDEKSKAARAQQQLLQLENLLLDPEWVHSVTVFYQLRALNTHLSHKLARFAEQLKQQREQRRHRQLLSEWNAQQGTRIAEIDAEVDRIDARISALESDLREVREGYAAMNGFLRFLRKRSTKRTLDRITGEHAELRSRRDALRQDREAIEADGAPDAQGLDMTSKRSINCMILSYAQELFLHFREDGVASMAREAGVKGAGAIRYGTRQECGVVLNRISKLRQSMPKTGELADRLQERARILAERARFRADDHAVPDVASVATVIDIHEESGAIREIDASLLADNYWGISQVVSR